MVIWQTQSTIFTRQLRVFNQTLLVRRWMLNRRSTIDIPVLTTRLDCRVGSIRHKLSSMWDYWWATAMECPQQDDQPHWSGFQSSIRKHSQDSIPDNFKRYLGEHFNSFILYHFNGWVNSLVRFLLQEDGTNFWFIPQQMGTFQDCRT